MSENPTANILTSLSDITATEWNALAGTNNPFLSHEFLYALEKSASATAQTGWLAQHIVVEQNNQIIAIAPCYLKNHSYGEYVFDHGWAEAFERAGGNYYPKLQLSIPFTPVTGPRLLVAKDKDQAAKISLAKAIEALCHHHHSSSAHITFLPHDDCQLLGEQNWLLRTGTQFHWHNQDYDNFDDFLNCLSSRKRKNIRKERARANSHGLTIEHLIGSDITEQHWDAFFAFYQDTGARKWGQPYLTRQFFSLLSDTMADRLLLIMARDPHDQYVAGALNFIGADTLYGRYWGAITDYPYLHFECCYYQAMEYAIQHRLAFVEAGAQGEHKLARGYLPQTTYSAHFIANQSFHRAIADYLSHERIMVAEDNALLAAHSPFRVNEDFDPPPKAQP